MSEKASVAERLRELEHLHDKATNKRNAETLDCYQVSVAPYIVDGWIELIAAIRAEVEAIAKEMRESKYPVMDAPTRRDWADRLAPRAESEK